MAARKETRPALGVWRCPMGGSALVYQTVKAGNHFYTHCACCGLQQGTGAARQQRIWDETEFYNRGSVVRPGNVAIDLKPESEPSEAATAEAVPDKGEADFDPGEREVDPEAEKQPEKREGGGVLKKVIPLVLLFGAGVVGSWMS